MAIAQLIKTEHQSQFELVNPAELAQKNIQSLINEEDLTMIECWLDKCELLVRFFQSASPEISDEISEKKLNKEIKAKGGWYSELSPKKISDMCAAYHWVDKATEQIGFNICWFTFQSFQKFIGLSNKLKLMIWEVWNSNECGEFVGEIITLPVLKKLKDMAMCRMSELRTIADLAFEMEGKGGTLARRVVAKVTELIEKTDESTIKEELLAIAVEASEVVNVDDKDSLESFESKVMAAEEMLANRMKPEVVKEAINSGCVEPTGTVLKALTKFNQKLAEAKKFGENCISSFSQINGEAKEEIKQRLKVLGSIQLSLNFDVA